jgi:hypothetical protein
MAVVVETIPICVLDNDGTELHAQIHGDLTATLVISMTLPTFGHQVLGQATLSVADLKQIICITEASQGKTPL